MASPEYVPSGSLKVARLAVDALWYLAWAAAVWVVVTTLVVGLNAGIRATLVKRGWITTRATQTLPIQVRYPDAADVNGVSSEPGHPRLAGHNDVVVYRDTSGGGIVSSLLFQVFVFAFVLLGIDALRTFLHTVSRGTPFDRRNPARLRRIAYLLIAYAPIDALLRAVDAVNGLRTARAAVQRLSPAATVGYEVTFNLAWLIVGLVVLAVAHAFEVGLRLQDDSDLTV